MRRNTVFLSLCVPSAFRRFERLPAFFREIFLLNKPSSFLSLLFVRELVFSMRGCYGVALLKAENLNHFERFFYSEYSVSAIVFYLK